MATLRNKRKLAAVTRETQEENPRNGQSRNTSVPRINEEYITQVSEEIEGRVSKKLSQKFSRTESRILGALSKLDEFLLNQQIKTHSETVPGTFRNTNVENQGTNEDDSQSDPHPEVGLFRSQTTRNSGPEVGHYSVRICWFKRNSSNLDRAPKMRDSVQLNSWDSFFVTLPSISSETCVIYSSLILGTDVFRDWPFLGFSCCISLVTAANFRLFLKVVIF